MDYIQASFQALKRKQDLRSTGRDECNWTEILNATVDALDEQDRRKGRAILSTTERMSMVRMMKSWLGRFQCLLDL